MDLKNKLETPNEETPLSRLIDNNHHKPRGRPHSELHSNDQNTKQNNSDDFRGSAWSQRQQQIINQQDDKLDLIGESVGALKAMSHNIGEELENHNRPTTTHSVSHMLNAMCFGPWDATS